eukprot:TRINITY_DN4180_c0_g1_i3.p1 TRINITY_DN4180_c0_g1~~TRINITY_DN4180_c0_g1_i3.p1  ORF type:complete len:363 (-),score=42.68 TRINITY_DN4180_c0_g1_i3:397-1485(-)
MADTSSFSLNGIRSYLGPKFLQSETVRLLLSASGILSSLMLYGVLQERIMKLPYGEEKEYFKFSLFLVLCNRALTCSVCVGLLWAQSKPLDPVAPLYSYAAVSLSNVVATTCQYEALKFVSFPTQTLAKCAKMMPVMIWGTIIMGKRYGPKDYFLAVLITVGCTVFLLTGESEKRHKAASSDSLWGILLMCGYLGFDGFTSTFQDKLFKGYQMDVWTQVLYTGLCSSLLSSLGLISSGQFFEAIQFAIKYPECLGNILVLSLAATFSQFLISYTIRTSGALVFATVMTTRQFLSILLSCVIFVHPLTWGQWLGTVMVFSTLYYNTLTKSHHKKAAPAPKSEDNEEQAPLKSAPAPAGASDRA